MKEFQQALNKTFDSIPKEFRNMATVRVAEYFLQFGFGNGLKTPRAKRWLHEMMNSWYKSEETPLSKFAKRLFEGFDFVFLGIENLNCGAEILAVNYPTRGPLRGNWFKCLVNLAVAEKRGWQGNFEARWILKLNSDSAIVEKTPISGQKRWIMKQGGKSCHTITVNPDSNFQKARAVAEMSKHLSNEGVLVICPEGRENKNLGRGKAEVGDLLIFLAKDSRIPIRPVGVWSQDDKLYVNFGKDIILGDQDLAGQGAVDLVMAEIAALLPEARRGIYQKVPSQKEDLVRVSK